MKPQTEHQAPGFSALGEAQPTITPREITNATSGTMTREEFERWIALQTAIGWTVKNPESVEKVRADFDKGATVAPFRVVPQNETVAV